MTARPKFATIDEYISASAPEVRGILEEIRKLVKETIPDAQETISYQMPAYKTNRVFMYFAAFKKHIGIYPPVSDKLLSEQLLPYRGEKGNLKFPLDEPMPYDLIARVAKTLAAQHTKSKDPAS